MADNQLGVKTRAMIEKEGANTREQEHQQTPPNCGPNTDQQPQPQQPTCPQPHHQDSQGLTQPRLESTRVDQENMEEYVRKHSNIGLDSYVPDLLNTRVIDMIRNKIHVNSRENKIMFNSTELGDYFRISSFELDLKTGQVYTYSTPVEDIGIPCQAEEFDIETLREHFLGQPDDPDIQTDKLTRVPLIRKRAPMAETMDLEEIEEKIQQYCQLWDLYAKASCELARRSKISQEEAADACKVLGPYIRDIMQQFEEVNTIFVMERELRATKNRGHFPIPISTPHGMKIENPQQAKGVLKVVEEEIIEITTRIRESKRAYEKGQEASRKQARTNYNFLGMNSSTPIKNSSTTVNRQQPTHRTTHFNPNTIHQYYSATEPTSHINQYEPPVNDSIIQGANTAPVTHLTVSTTTSTGHNAPWRNNGNNSVPQQACPNQATNTTNCNVLFNDSPNSSNDRNGPTCFKCGEQGHIRNDCTNRVFCNNCNSRGHCDRTCRKLRNNTPSPINAHIPTGYHPTATPPPLNDQNPTTTIGTANYRPWFQNQCELNQPKINTTEHTPPTNNMSPAQEANMTEAFTQIMSQFIANNKGDGMKQMMKNIKTFDGTNKSECITWLSQIEAASKFSNLSFRELLCQGMAPSMLHVLTELPVTATDDDIKT